MIGYFAVVGIAALLDRQARPAPSAASVGGAAGYERSPSGVLALLARDRWVWVVPIVIDLTVYALLILHQPVPLIGPMMYRVF
jgi:hypothetical protein